MTLSTLQKRITRTKISWIFILIIFIFCFVNTNAQTGLNFQGVARNSNNVILASQQISLRLSVLQGTATGVAEYTETRTVTTNAQGLFTAVIGDLGATSTLGNFTTINWKNTPKFLKIEMDLAAGTNFTTMGTTQFQYVAYAQFANGVDAENIAGIVPVARGGTGTSSLAALKTALAIDKINNTTDAEKPISTKTQAALDLILVTATDTARFSNRINAKANTLDVTTSLALKLNKTDTSNLLQKADTITLSNRIDLKVDKVAGKELSTNDYTTAEKTKLTVITGTNTGDQDLSSYATNTALALKANTSDINISLGLKASVTDVTTSLALKEDATNKSAAADLGGVSPSDILYPTQKAVKDFVAANSASGGVADGGITNIKLADGAVTNAKLGELVATINGGTGVATTTANTFFAGPNGTSGAPSFRTLVAADLPNISTSYIQNTPDATQTGSIDISGNAKIGTTLNVNGIYFGIGKNNQSTNTAIGNTALQGLDDGYNNTAIGNFTMKDNNGGYNNTSVGANAFQNLTTGIDNTALGYYAMLNSTSGNFNTATGSLALSSNTGAGNSGSYNVANGYKAMLYNQTGSKNVGVGYYVLLANRTGSNNTAIGNQADVASGDLTNATAIGNGAIVSGSNSIQLGNASVTMVNTSGGITTGGTITANGGVFTSTTISGNETVIGTLNANVGVFTSTTISGVAIINGKIISGASSSASPSALVEVNSTTQGFLPPRMTLAQRNAISSPAAGLMIWCSDNFGGEIEVFNGTKWVNMNGRSSNTTLSIGDYYQGGRIAYILVSGDPGYDANIQHGLIAATSDQSTAIRWYNGTNTSTGATGTAIGTGLSNTNAIIASQGETATSYAAGLARAYNGGGYTDWYLPSYVEVQKIFLNRVAIGGFGSNYYWSSTEDTSTPGWAAAWAFAFEFNPVIPLNNYKSYGYGSVRAIRSF